ncbi:fumarylacetoacetate hydrolase family protein [Streptomyces sp. NBC_01515]|uniref:2-keto-4-pentenoate hydratase n=1 Tax=Streptomyces sp. NBC_01515 TaxID=2903890 RepID=UPI00386F6545
MSATAGQREAAGRLLREAEQHVTPIDPLTALLPALDLADAYAVQQDNVTQRLAAGARLVGYKVEPTSAAMHTRPGIDEPAYGHLLDDTLHRDGGTVRTARYCSPRVQPEICFRLARPLRGPGVRALDVLTATEAVAPVLEIVDSRVRDWRITLADTVADNVGSAGLVCGAWTPFERAPDLAAVTVDLFLDGEHVATGSGETVLGHPAAAVAWLANTLAAHGAQLEAGNVVLSGAMTIAPFVKAGQKAEARFRVLGPVSMSFV